MRRAIALGGGRCRFSITEVGGRLDLTVTKLRRRTRYYYVVIVRDNVSLRLGPRSRSVGTRAA